MKLTSIMNQYSKSLSSKFKVADTIVIIGFTLFLFTYFLGRWKGAYPFVFLGSDAANIANFAAGWDHPDLFQKDFFLSNQDNFRFYATIHIPLIRLLANIIGDYGSAFISLLIPHIFLQACGFYILGRVIFQSRYWGAFLAVVTLIPVWLNLGTYWGIYIDPQPRFSFQVLLPYLLASAYYWRTKLTVWPWLMVAAGGFIYIHPVSAPGWAIAIWLGFWFFLPASFSIQKRLAYMFFVGAICCGVTLPWLIHYLSNHAHGATDNYSQIYEALASNWGEGFLDIPLAVKGFISLIWQKGILPLAIVSIVLVVWLRRNELKSVMLLLIWLAGILLVAVGIPWIEQTIAQTNEAIPAQVDLIRGIRYLVPLMLLFIVWTLAEISQQFSSTKVKIATTSIGIALIFWLTVQPTPPTVRIPNQLNYTLSCWREGKLTCTPKDYIEIIEGLNKIKQLTPQSTILPLDKIGKRLSLPIRYYSLQPLVYAFKDRAALSYANHSKFLKWIQRNEQVQLLEEQKAPEDKLKGIIELSNNWEVQYCLTEPSINDAVVKPPYSNKLEIIYTNSLMTLLKIKK